MRHRNGVVSALTALVCLACAAPSSAAVTPVAECIVHTGGGIYQVYYGYVNPGAQVSVPFGSSNEVVPGLGYQGQPEVFNAGSYPRVFRAVFNSNAFPGISWELDGSSGLATTTTPQCASGATGPAGELTPASARLHGLIESDNTDTAYYFDYGTTIAYGSNTPERRVTTPRGRLVDEVLTGLTPGTTYHYRLVSSGATTTVGEGRTFTTPAQPNPPADVALAQTASPGAVLTGDRVTSRFTVSNAGGAGATGVRVVNPLPAGTLYDATGSSDSCSLAGSTVTCTVTSLGAGEQASVTVAWVPGRVGIVTNAAVVTADQPDPVAADNVSTADVAVTQRGAPVGDPPAQPERLADLTLKRSGGRPVRKGKRVAIVLTITNRGPLAATGVTLVERLPSGVRLVSASWPGGKCSGRTRLTCGIGSIAPGAKVRVTIKVLARRSGRFSDTASVAGAQPDPRAADNVAVGTLRVR